MGRVIWWSAGRHSRLRARRKGLSKDVDLFADILGTWLVDKVASGN